MTCYHPIKAFIVEDNDGDKKYHFASNDTDRIVYKGQAISKHILLPCGKCIGCQCDKSRDWANRIMLELMYHEKACFLTLTYNEDYIPHNEYNDYAAGEVKLSNTLRKEQLQKFFKRLRKHIAPVKIRYFACGEYGKKSLRPHYHVIVFGYDFPDKYVFNVTKDGYVQYRSDLLELIWTDPVTHESLGHSMICEVNWNTAAYVSRYCLKKSDRIHNIYYQTFNVEPEFLTMSRRPGIGRQYYDEHKDEVYINQEIFLSNNKGGFKTRPPKYFDRLYESEHPEEMKEMKERRMEIAQRNLDQKMLQTNLSLHDYLEVEEAYFRERIRSLKREKV